VDEAEQASQEWPTWRPGLASRLLWLLVVAPVCAVFSVVIVAGVFQSPHDVFGPLIGLGIGLTTFGAAFSAASVVSVTARIEGERLVFRNRLWSDREIPLSSITAVRPASQGLIVTRGDDTTVAVHAFMDPFGISERAAAAARQIEAAAARLREDL
jgi:hypothetical protein